MMIAGQQLDSWFLSMGSHAIRQQTRVGSPGTGA